MASGLRYVPKATPKQPDMDRPNFTRMAGAEEEGVAKLAEGVYNLANSLGNIKKHLDGVDDANATTDMLADIEIKTQEGIVAFEASDPDPEKYQSEVENMHQKISTEISKGYKFKTTDGASQYKRSLDALRGRVSANAIKRGYELRIKRGIANWHIAADKLLQGATMSGDHRTAVDAFDEALKKHVEYGVGAGLFGADRGGEIYREMMSAADSFYAVEQAEENPDEFIKFAENEPNFFAEYKWLDPKQLQELRARAKNASIRKRNERDDTIKEKQQAWDRTYMDLLEKYEREPNPQNKATYLRNLEDHLYNGAKSYKSPSTLQSFLNALHAPKAVKTDPSIYMNYHNKIKSGQDVDPMDWWAEVPSGGLKIDDARELDAALEKYNKNTGMPNQWPGIYEIIDAKIGIKGKPTPKQVLKRREMVSMLQYIQRESKFADNNPVLTRMAKELKDREYEIPRESWMRWVDPKDTRDLYDDLIEEKPWDTGQWPYKRYFDPRIPTASELEIDQVDKNIKMFNEELIANGQKQVLDPDSPRVRQMFLNNLRKGK